MMRAWIRSSNATAFVTRKLLVVGSAVLIALAVALLLEYPLARLSSLLHAQPAPATPSTPPYNASKLALLLEDRPLPHLKPLLLHMISVVPADWRFLFVGSRTSIDFVNATTALQLHERTGKLSFSELPARARDRFRNQNALSVLLTDPAFWRWLGGSEHWDYTDPWVKDWDGRGRETGLRPQTEWVLLFQPDSILCANSDQSLNDYIQYDWVGAPWVYHAGGNGGLSLRRVSSMLRILAAEARDPDDVLLEDLWFCERLPDLPGVVLPNRTVASRFSVEEIWQERPLGYHTGWAGKRLAWPVWTQRERREKIFEYCPEIKMALSMELSVVCNDEE